MSTSSEFPQPAAKNQNRRKKARAIMASGLVLGVGAAVTLAAWSDTVWGAGTFGTEDSAFNIQGSFDGSTWGEFVTETDAGTMNFGSKATGMMPGDTVHALVGLREQFDKMDSEVTLTKVTGGSTELGKWITVGVSEPQTTKPEDCATVQPATTTLLNDANKVMDTFDLPAGETRWFCFSATLDDKIPAHTKPETIKDVQWKFDGASGEKAADDTTVE
ncbi:hypothetical protein GQF49_05800 [Microbacter sp. ANSKLAB05]|nr:hypothetical protein [Microbacter sp. ANSKLAB05]